jgi:hypothetical protein
MRGQLLGIAESGYVVGYYLQRVAVVLDDLLWAQKGVSAEA